LGKKQHKQQVLRYELTGMLILTLSALSLGKLGVVGRYLDVAFIYLAGSWSFLVPIFIGYAAIYIMVRRTAFPWTYRHMGLLVLFLTWLTTMELVLFEQISALYSSREPDLFTVTLGRIHDMSNAVLNPTSQSDVTPEGAGGGLIGYVFFALFNYLFSIKGTKLVLWVGVLIGGALVTEQSLVRVVQRGTAWMEQKLDGLWKASKSYIEVLFGRDTPGTRSKSSKKRSDDTGADTNSRRKRKVDLIVEAEVVPEGNPGDSTNDAEPIPVVVHDFAAKLRAKHQAESQTVNVEQVGNRMIAKYSERDASLRQKKGTREAEAEVYPVGAPIHDENYRLPPLDIFALPEAPKGGFDLRSAQENARKLEMTLESFGVQAKVLEISRGPTVTRYEVQPAVGVKVSRIVSLTDDIALSLAARDIRIEAPVPGKSVVGIEVPNSEIAVVTLREVLESPEFQKEESKLAVALGRDITGAAIVGNLQKMPHLLVAGATGSGKSVCINGIIASLLVKAKPHEVKLMMIDPKMVELSGYNGIPHLLAPVVTDPRKAAWALKKIVQEMERRYQAFAERGARDIERFNQMLKADGLELLPYIVVIVDELADLMMVAPGDVEDAICRIAQMARAAGIHLIVATQRPSVDVITGVIKANIPSRIAFSVSSMADSRTILDSGGAEKLLGRGDMLYLPVGASKPTRVQGAYVSESEIEALVAYVKDQQPVVYTVDLNHVEESSETEQNSDLDSLFLEAVDLVVESKQASVSMLQRRFRIGYSRAARIVDQMELHGIVGPFEGSRPREVLITAEQWQSMRAAYNAPRGGLGDVEDGMS
jgi:DNA segregation ATPase FtsK/SpoIIIE, S-DNA-T family